MLSSSVFARASSGSHVLDCPDHGGLQCTVENDAEDNAQVLTASDAASHTEGFDAQVLTTVMAGQQRAAQTGGQEAAHVAPGSEPWSQDSDDEFRGFSDGRTPGTPEPGPDDSFFVGAASTSGEQIELGVKTSLVGTQKRRKKRHEQQQQQQQQQSAGDSDYLECSRRTQSSHESVLVKSAESRESIPDSSEPSTTAAKKSKTFGTFRGKSFFAVRSALRSSKKQASVEGRQREGKSEKYRDFVTPERPATASSPTAPSTSYSSEEKHSSLLNRGQQSWSYHDDSLLLQDASPSSSTPSPNWISPSDNASKIQVPTFQHNPSPGSDYSLTSPPPRQPKHKPSISTSRHQTHQILSQSAPTKDTATRLPTASRSAEPTRTVAPEQVDCGSRLSQIKIRTEASQAYSENWRRDVEQQHLESTSKFDARSQAELHDPPSEASSQGRRGLKVRRRRLAKEFDEREQLGDAPCEVQHASVSDDLMDCTDSALHTVTLNRKSAGKKQRSGGKFYTLKSPSAAAAKNLETSGKSISSKSIFDAFLRKRDHPEIEQPDILTSNRSGVMQPKSTAGETSVPLTLKRTQVRKTGEPRLSKSRKGTLKKRPHSSSSAKAKVGRGVHVNHQTGHRVPASSVDRIKGSAAPSGRVPSSSKQNGRPPQLAEHGATTKRKQQQKKKKNDRMTSLALVKSTDLYTIHKDKGTYKVSRNIPED